MAIRDITLEDTFTFDFTTRALTGIPTVLANTPVLSVKETGNDTPITAGVTIDVDTASVVGYNEGSVVATAANGYEDLKTYGVYISTGTVDGVSVIGEQVYEFTIGYIAKILRDIHLDHLLAVAESDTPVDDSIIAKMVDRSSTADWSSYLHTEDSLRAISEKVSGIGSATGGGFSFAPLSDDVLEDTINDAAAVDKSTSPATVGIPVTGAEAAGWLAGDECTIAGSTNYEGQHVIDSVTTNEIVIVATYTAETFATDTIKRTIKATRLVGVETTNTFAAVSAQDGDYHVIDDAADTFAISYRFNVGGGRIATEADFTGFLNSGNDDGKLQAWNFVTSAWETRHQLPGQGGSVNQTITVPLLARNTGTSGVELGQVLMRVTHGDTNSNPTLNVDSFLVEAIGIGQTAGYQNGAIWVDTNNGVAGTESFVNGTADNPVLTWADALALSTALNLTDFHIINGSTITLTATSDNFSLTGDNWTLDLNGQSCVDSYFQGAGVSGVATAASGEVHFEGCDIGTSSIQSGHYDVCGFSATVTMTLAGDYNFHDCYSKVAGAASPTFTKTGGQTITAEFRRFSGGITMSGIESGDVMTLDFDGAAGTITLNGAEGTVEVRGIYKAIVDNRTGSPTLNTDGAIKGVDVASILADTNEMQGDQVDGGRLDLIWDAILADTAVWGAAGSEPTGVPAVDETPLVKLDYLYMAFRNKITVTATKKTYYDDAGGAEFEKDVSDDATTYTETEANAI